MAKSRKTKIITTISIVAVIGLALFIFFRFFFVYSNGINAGDLNYFQHEGVVFKTYEGKIIQSGIKSDGKNTEGLHSNELKFSVTDKAVADKLMHCSGKRVELRWKRYIGTPALAWQQPVHRHRNRLRAIRSKTAHPPANNGLEKCRMAVLGNTRETERSGSAEDSRKIRNLEHSFASHIDLQSILCDYD